MLVILAVPARFQPLPEAIYRFKTAPKRKPSPESENLIPDPPPPGGAAEDNGTLSRPRGLWTLTHISSIAWSLQRFSVDPNPTPLPYNPDPHRDLPMLLENTNHLLRLIIGADHHQPYSHVERPIHLALRHPSLLPDQPEDSRRLRQTIQVRSKPAQS